MPDGDVSGDASTQRVPNYRALLRYKYACQKKFTCEQLVAGRPPTVVHQSQNSLVKDVTQNLSDVGEGAKNTVTHHTDHIPLDLYDLCVSGRIDPWSTRSAWPVHHVAG